MSLHGRQADMPRRLTEALDSPESAYEHPYGRSVSNGLYENQATALNLLTASELAQRRRLRMASSTRAKACFASRAACSAISARTSAAVALSSAAAMRNSACVRALEASWSLQPASATTSRNERSADSIRFSPRLSRSAAVLNIA